MSNLELRPPTPEDPEAKQQREDAERAKDMKTASYLALFAWGFKPEREHVDVYRDDDYNAANDIDQ